MSRIEFILLHHVAALEESSTDMRVLARVEGVADSEVSVGLRRILCFYEGAQTSPLVWY